MNEDTPQDLALLLQAYLSIHYVQRYLLPKEVYSKERTFSRYLISTKALNNLPIPRFSQAILKEKSFKELYLRRVALDARAMKLNRYSRQILNCISKDEDETINLFLGSQEKLPSIHKKEIHILNRLDALLNEFVLLQEECNISPQTPI